MVDPQQAVPEKKAQRNFTDADSRIMKDGATGGFVQGYNCQAVVDSQAQITDNQLQGIDLYVAPERLRHGEKIAEVGDQAPPSAQPTLIEPMREKLKTAQGHAVYKMRKAIVEPVFGQIKEARGVSQILTSRRTQSGVGVAVDLPDP